MFSHHQELGEIEMTTHWQVHRQEMHPSCRETGRHGSSHATEGSEWDPAGQQQHNISQCGGKTQRNPRGQADAMRRQYQQGSRGPACKPAVVSQAVCLLLMLILGLQGPRESSSHTALTKQPGSEKFISNAAGSGLCFA